GLTRHVDLRPDRPSPGRPVAGVSKALTPSIAAAGPAGPGTRRARDATPISRFELSSKRRGGDLAAKTIRPGGCPVKREVEPVGARERGAAAGENPEMRRG